MACKRKPESRFSSTSRIEDGLGVVGEVHHPRVFLAFVAAVEAEHCLHGIAIHPQLIKTVSVSDLMKQIRQTEVIKAAVEYRGSRPAPGR